MSYLGMVVLDLDAPSQFRGSSADRVRVALSNADRVVRLDRNPTFFTSCWASVEPPGRALCLQL